jgi:hypothetical protein
MLSKIPYEDVMPDPLKLPPRDTSKIYVRTPIEDQNFVPMIY